MPSQSSKNHRLSREHKRLLESARVANGTSIFFTLPRELRDQIYHWLLVAGNDLIGVEPTIAAGKLPALSQVCAQLRSESSHVFFQNRFLFNVVAYNIDTLVRWRESMHSYMKLRGPSTAFKIRFCWQPVSSVDEKVLKKNLLRCLEYAFNKYPGLLDQRLMDGASFNNCRPMDQSRANLFSMVQALKTQGFTWDKIWAAVAFTIDAAMICGERRV